MKPGDVPEDDKTDDQVFHDLTDEEDCSGDRDDDGEDDSDCDVDFAARDDRRTTRRRDVETVQLERFSTAKLFIFFQKKLLTTWMT